MIAEFAVEAGDVTTIEASGATIQVLDDALLSLGLFATKKVVVIPNLGELPKPVASRLITLLSTVSDETLLILEADKVDQRTELAKAVKKLPTETFEPLQGSALDRWIGEQVTQLGVQIEPAARSRLIERVGSNSWRLRSELEKLATAALPVRVMLKPDEPRRSATGPSRSRNEFGMTPHSTDSRDPEIQPMITQSHVTELTLATTSPAIFALTDALVAGQRAKARLALTKLLASGEEPLGLLGMLGFHLRTLVLVKDADVTKLPAKLHPFVVQKTLPAARRISWPQLADWYEQLAAYDMGAKTGTMEPVVALELLVHHLSG